MSECDDVILRRIRPAAVDEEGTLVFHGLDALSGKIRKGYVHRDGEVGGSQETLVTHDVSNLPNNSNKIQMGRFAVHTSPCSPNAVEQIVAEDLVYVEPCESCWQCTEEGIADLTTNREVAQKLLFTLTDIPGTCCGAGLNGLEIELEACANVGLDVPQNLEHCDNTGYSCADLNPGAVIGGVFTSWEGQTDAEVDLTDCAADPGGEIVETGTLKVRASIVCTIDTTTPPYECHYFLIVEMQIVNLHGDELGLGMECCVRGGAGEKCYFRYFKGCVELEKRTMLCGAFDKSLDLHCSHRSDLGHEDCGNCVSTVSVKGLGLQADVACEPCFDLEPYQCPGGNAINPTPYAIVANLLELKIGSIDTPCSTILAGARISLEACPTNDPHGCAEPVEPCVLCPNPPAEVASSTIAAWHSGAFAFGDPHNENNVAIIAATARIKCWFHPGTEIPCHSLEVDLCIDANIEGDGGCCERCGRYRGCVDIVGYAQRCGYFHPDPLPVTMRCMEPGDDCKGCSFDVELSVITSTP